MSKPYIVTAVSFPKTSRIEEYFEIDGNKAKPTKKYLAKLEAKTPVNPDAYLEYSEWGENVILSEGWSFEQFDGCMSVSLLSELFGEIEVGSMSEVDGNWEYGIMKDGVNVNVPKDYFFVLKAMNNERESEFKQPKAEVLE